MLDGFDHREDEEPGDERLSLLGEDTEKGGERLGNGEEEEEFQGRSCSDKSVMSKIDSPETVLRKNGSPTWSPSVEESTTGHAPALVVATRNTISNHSNVPHPLALPATLHFLLRKTFSATKEAIAMSGTVVLTSAVLPQLAGSSPASLERTTGEDISKISILELPSANLTVE
ncbi:hypothetical protein BKA61DRAFT_584654 [Leptodontidium sp. MPI-SDFR-AT-0119]|nr:hypothetical protein BKA61DRAFT_584654 [Leptodontidium sp. MPI-SDFR-AT-0119]